MLCSQIDWLMIAYIALFSALLSRLTALACGSTWVTSFIARFFVFCFIFFICFFHWVSTEVVYLLRWHGWCHMKLQPSRCRSCVHHYPYNHAPCHFMQSHIRKVYWCLAVICHLHFWQNDRDLLGATAVTREWNGHLRGFAIPACDILCFDFKPHGPTFIAQQSRSCEASSGLISRNR